MCSYTSYIDLALLMFRNTSPVLSLPGFSQQGCQYNFCAFFAKMSVNFTFPHFAILQLYLLEVVHIRVIIGLENSELGTRHFLACNASTGNYFEME